MNRSTHSITKHSKCIFILYEQNVIRARANAVSEAPLVGKRKKEKQNYKQLLNHSYLRLSRALKMHLKAVCTSY